jgi:hypothetical protein
MYEVGNSNLYIYLSSDVEVFPPFPATESSISTHITYLDTTGRPAITFKYAELTDRHNQIIYVRHLAIFSIFSIPSNIFVNRWLTRFPYPLI